jgi:hypothetical protein
MVSPFTVDSEVVLRNSLPLKSQAAHQGDRRLIVRLNVRLQPMQSEIVESKADGGPHRLGHQPLPGEVTHSIVSQISTLKCTEHHLSDIHHASDPPEQPRP